MSNEPNSTECCSKTPKPNNPLSKLKWIGIGLIVIGTLWTGFGSFRETCVRVVGMENEISEVTKKQALYELSMIQNKLKVQGVITEKFSKLESDNVQRNMDSKRAIAIGIVGLMGGDLKSVAAPTNGLMQLQHSNEFYKELMANAGTEYVQLKKILDGRAQKIKDYEVFLADPVNRWIARLGGYPSIDLKAEKSWTLLTQDALTSNTTHTIKPVNPLGKNQDIQE